MIRFGNIARWYIAAIWLSVWSLCSCTEDIDPEFSAESAPQYGIVLTTGTMNTRAGTVAGENTENTISNYAIFLYSSEGDNQQPVYALSGTCNAANSTTVTAKVPLDKIPELFGNGTTCYAYALVNYPATVDINTTALTIKGEGMETAAAATIANIKALQVSSDDFSRTAAPSAFVMHGASTESGITLSDDGKNMTGTIPLKRVASKIKLWVNILDKIYVDKDNRTVERTEGVSEAEFEAELLRNGGAVCIPRLDNVNTFINNGVKTARIDGTTMEMVTTDDGNTAEQCWLQDADYFSVARSRTNFRPITEATNPEEGWNYQRTHDIPMYSYPNTWTSSIEENRQTHLLLMVNWNIRRQGDGDNANYKPCYYFIPVNARSATPNRLESNKYYRIGVNVGMLGSFNPGEPQIIESATWEVLDWTKEPIDATLKGSRYLVLNQTEFVMNNEDSIQIPFTASHEVEIKNVYVTYFRFNDTWGYHPQAQETGNRNNNEFTVRKTAYNNLKNSGKKEGLLTNTTYGDVYAWEGYYDIEDRYDDGYDDDGYYVGREHPKTIAQSANKKPNLTEAQDTTAWNLYKEKYKLDSLYQYGIKDNKVVFNHPLIRWEERYGNNLSTTGTGAATAYVPVLNASKTGFKDAYSRYDITIIIGFKDDENDAELQQFRQIIHIQQYPALYINVSHNPGSVSTSFLLGYRGGNEYVKINNNSTFASTLGRPWEIDGQGVFGVTNSVLKFNGTNNNPNMYVITTTQLSEDNDKISEEGDDRYIIGDPRSLTVNNDLSDASVRANINWTQTWSRFQYIDPSNVNNWCEAPATNIPEFVNGSSTKRRTLENYYPTDESTDAGSKKNFIAPVIRVASSFGKIGTMQYKYYARRRCAAYQEAGRPAGRWRLPTKAEVLYILNLARDGIIPILFGLDNTTSYYWTANGEAEITISGNSITTSFSEGEDSEGVIQSDNRPAVRCVYDDWYWVKDDGSEDIPADAPKTTQFYWGDKEKDNPQTSNIKGRWAR